MGDADGDGADESPAHVGRHADENGACKVAADTHDPEGGNRK